ARWHLNEDRVAGRGEYVQVAVLGVGGRVQRQRELAAAAHIIDRDRHWTADHVEYASARTPGNVAEVHHLDCFVQPRAANRLQPHFGDLRQHTGRLTLRAIIVRDVRGELVIIEHEMPVDDLHRRTATHRRPANLIGGPLHVRFTVAGPYGLLQPHPRYLRLVGSRQRHAPTILTPRLIARCCSRTSALALAWIG